jgi:hypothetical protein
MKILGALVKLKDMTNHSYKPNLVLKEVFHSFLFDGNHFASQSL